jgi:hypothetical protein
MTTSPAICDVHQGPGPDIVTVGCVDECADCTMARLHDAYEAQFDDVLLECDICQSSDDVEDFDERDGVALLCAACRYRRGMR